MKIIQIRALDYVEAVYQATKKRKLVGALCRVLDDWSRFASRGGRAELKKKDKLKRRQRLLNYPYNISIVQHVSLSHVKDYVLMRKRISARLRYIPCGIILNNRIVW